MVPQTDKCLFHWGCGQRLLSGNAWQFGRTLHGAILPLTGACGEHEMHSHAMSPHVIVGMCGRAVQLGRPEYLKHWYLACVAFPNHHSRAKVPIELSARDFVQGQPCYGMTL